MLKSFAVAASLGVLATVLLPSPAFADAAVPAAEKLRQELAARGPQGFTARDYHRGVVRHVVLFRYKPDTSPETKAQIKKRFLALKQLCKRDGKPYVVSIETGAQSSGEGVDQGLEQAFIVTFASEGDRNYYVGQPVVTDASHSDAAHQAFKDFVGPYLHEPINPTGVVVFDFQVEPGAR
jgi:hypothetical protein